MANITITDEQIKKIKDTYQSNHETIVDMTALYENGDINASPEESFEQGYENAIEFVCETLNIPLD